MGVWLVSVVVSGLAAAAAVYGLLRVPQFPVHVPPDWRVVAAMAAGLHAAAGALVYGPFVRALQWRVSRAAMCALTAPCGLLPFAAMLLLQTRRLDLAIAAAREPVSWLLAGFFVIGAGGFGLLRHEHDPRIAALEKRLAILEDRVPGT